MSTTLPNPSVLARRRRIGVCLVAIFTILIAECLARHMEPTLKAYDVADLERKPGALRKSGIPDIVLMGSSRAKYALVPEEFEAAGSGSAFNLGIAGTKTVEWLTLARRLFDAEEPGCVVLGVNASEFRADYLPTQAAQHLFDFDDLLESARLDGPSRDVLSQYLRRRMRPVSALYHRRYELRMWAQERLATWLPKQAQHSRELRARVARPCPPKGFAHPWAEGRQLRDLGQRLLEDRARVVASSVPTFAPDAPALRRLDQLLAWFRQREIAILVAYLPNSPETERRWSHVEPAMIEAIESVCRARDVPFLRCPQSVVPRTNRDFLEEIHVGLPLARRISRRIADRMVALAMLDEHPARLAATPESDDGLP